MKEKMQAYLMQKLKEESTPIEDKILNNISTVLFNTILKRLNNLNRNLLAGQSSFKKPDARIVESSKTMSKFPIYGLHKNIDINIILYMEDELSVIGGERYALKILMANNPFCISEQKIIIGDKEIAKSLFLAVMDKSRSSQAVKIALAIKKLMLKIVCEDNFTPLIKLPSQCGKRLFTKKNKFKFKFSSMIDVDHFVENVSVDEDIYNRAEAKFKPRILSIFLPSDTKMPIIGANNKTLNIIINSEKTVCLVEINSYADYEYLHKLFWERKLNMPYDMFNQLSKIWGEVMISVDYGVLAEPTDGKLFTTSNGKYQMLLKNKDEVINYFGKGE